MNNLILIFRQSATRLWVQKFKMADRVRNIRKFRFLNSKCTLKTDILRIKLQSRWCRKLKGRCPCVCGVKSCSVSFKIPVWIENFVPKYNVRVTLWVTDVTYFFVGILNYMELKSNSFNKRIHALPLEPRTGGLRPPVGGLINNLHHVV